MSKRIKRVFTNLDQVLHLWANQAQSDARSANVFFEGKSCFSYGRHYELGRLVEIKGRTVALINTKGYSRTTSKHIYYAKCAVTHMPRIDVGYDFNWIKGLKAMREAIDARLADQLRRRGFYAPFEQVIKHLHEEILAHAKLCRAVGKPNLAAKLPKAYMRDLLKHMDKVEARQAPLRAERAAKQAARELEQKRREQAAIPNWRCGNGSSLYGIRPQILRIKGDTVETSGGAQVPLADAKALLGAIGSELHSRVIGQKIGGFEITKVCDGIVTIGCHEIAIAEGIAVLEQGYNEFVKQMSETPTEVAA